MTRTTATLFSGFEGVSIGAIDAGLTHLWGVEFDPDIAEVAIANGFNTIVNDVCNVDYENLPKPWHLHASPVCKNASTAKVNGEESIVDIDTANAVCRAIEALRPTLFTLENVRGYLNFTAFKNIMRTLRQLGYQITYDVLNAANYGGLTKCPKHANCAGMNSASATAPDIVAAAATMRPEDHAKILAWDVVANLVKATRVGIAENAIWLEVEKALGVRKGKKTTNGRAEGYLTIEDTSKLELTDTTVESIVLLLKECLDDNSLKMRLSITSTEIQRITVNLICRCFLATESICQRTTQSDERNGCPLCKYSGVPQTRERLIVVARNDGKRPRMPEHTHARADLLGSMFETRLPWVGWYEAIEDLIAGLPDAQFAPWQLARLPDLAIAGTTLVTGMANTSRDATLLAAEKPSATVITNWGHRPSHMASAYLVNESSTMEIRSADQPTATQVASPSRALKAFIVPGGNASSFDVREADAPARTVGDTERVGNAPRASINGSIVKMTPRCLARFQSFPDSYVLPESARLATTGIGNAVPPLLMQRVLEANL